MSSPTNSASSSRRSPPSQIPTLRRTDSTFSLDKGPQLREAQIALDRCENSSVRSEDSTKVAKPTRTITAKLAAQLDSDLIYNRLTKAAKNALLNGLNEIEAVYQERITICQEDPATQQSLDYLV